MLMGDWLNATSYEDLAVGVGIKPMYQRSSAPKSQTEAPMSNDQLIRSRRNALKCLAYGGAGTVFTLTGGVFMPIDLAVAADKSSQVGRPLFVQISDTHIGFNKPANPDVGATLARSIELVNSMSTRPALVIHTGDITHLSKAEEFDAAQRL